MTSFAPYLSFPVQVGTWTGNRKAVPDGVRLHCMGRGLHLDLDQCGSGEMANTLALGASAARLGGSSPPFRTNLDQVSAQRPTSWFPGCRSNLGAS